MKVVILCGGRGTRMEKETEYRPKPMIEIGHKPILLHIMNIYASYGFREFILCLGYKGEVIKNYFMNYASYNSDFTLDLKTSKVTTTKGAMPDWKITMVDTGYDAMTGARIKKIEKYFDGDDFMLTYGDAVSNVDIKKLAAFHKKHGRIATMTGVFPLYKSRFGELSTDENIVVKFTEKPVNCAALTNGGFFVLKRKIFDYISDKDSCVFEKEALEPLVKQKQLALFKHEDFWHCMDNPRDMQFLNQLWAGGKAPWAGKGCKKGDWKCEFDRDY